MGCLRDQTLHFPRPALSQFRPALPHPPLVRSLQTRQTPSCYRLPPPQQCHPRIPLSSLRGPPQSPFPRPPPRLDGLSRHQIGLPPRPALSTFPDLMLNRVRGPSLLLPSADLWYQHRSKILVPPPWSHPRKATFSSTLPEAHLLHGRHPPGLPSTPHLLLSPPPLAINPSLPRTRDLLGEVSADSNTQYSPPWFHHQLRDSFLHHSSGQTSRHPLLPFHRSVKTVSTIPLRPISPREVTLDSPGLRSRQTLFLAPLLRDLRPTSPSPRAPPSQKHLPSDSLPLSTRGSPLDSFQHSPQPLPFLLDNNTNPLRLHRRLSHRLGMLLPQHPSVSLRPLVSSSPTKPPSHPAPRDGSSRARNLFSKPAATFQNSPLYRQSGRPCLPQKMGRYPLSCSPRPHFRSMGHSHRPPLYHRSSLVHPIGEQLSRRSTLQNSSSQLVDHLVRNSLKASSRSFYDKVAASFNSFLNSPLCPSSSSTLTPDHSAVTQFLASLHGTSWSKSIYRIISALKHHFASLDIAFSLSPMQELLVSGIAKTAPPPKHLVRHPLLPQHLLDIWSRNVPSGHSPSHSFLQTFCVLTLALRFGLRPLEVASIQFRNVTATNNCITITFQRFKALSYVTWVHDQPIHPVPAHMDNTICPFRILTLYLSQRALYPSSSSAALFPRSEHDPSSISPLDVNAYAKSLAASIGLSGIYGHSPRIGNATGLTLLNYPVVEIRSQGNWGKKTYLRYIRNARTWTTSNTVLSSFFPPPS